MPKKPAPKTKKPGRKASAGTRTARKPTPAPASPAASFGAQYQFREADIPIADITNGLNYRQDIDPAYIAELAGSIREHGIQTRLWLWMPPKPIKGCGHQLIAGECRWLAAQQAGALMAPAKIYEGLTREQALTLNLLENLQRQDANPMDEALGFKRLMEECGFVADDDTQPERSIRHQTGKSRTYVYAALKLADLGKTGQAAVRKGEISPSVGVRIARIPGAKNQAAALADAIAYGWTDERAAREIERRFMTELKGAPFDREDATLHPERPSCRACPFRSGNQKEFFDEMSKGRADICTDPACYQLKCKVSFDRRASAHEEAGGKVLAKKEAEDAGITEHYVQPTGKYVALADEWLGHTDLEKPIGKLLAAAIKEDPTLVILARGPGGQHVELIERATAASLLQLKDSGSSSSSGGENQYAREHREKTERAKAIVRWQLGAIAAYATAWASRADLIATGIPADPHIQLLERQLFHQLSTAGVDQLRLVCVRRQINPKDFRLDADQDTPAGRMKAGLEAYLRTASNAERVGLLFELMAAPTYVNYEGEIAGDAAEDAVNFLQQDLAKLHAAAKAAVDDELKAKLGKKKGELL